MRDNGIRARHKRRYRVSTDLRHKLPVMENLPARNFTPRAPNLVSASDITYIWTDEGRLYLAIVLDLFNREVVGWSIKSPRHHQRIGHGIGRVMTPVLIAPVRVMQRAGLGPASELSRQSWPNLACDA